MCKASKELPLLFLIQLTSHVNYLLRFDITDYFYLSFVVWLYGIKILRFLEGSVNRVSFKRLLFHKMKHFTLKLEIFSLGEIQLRFKSLFTQSSNMKYIYCMILEYRYNNLMFIKACIVVFSNPRNGHLRNQCQLLKFYLIKLFKTKLCFT